MSVAAMGEASGGYEVQPGPGPPLRAAQRDTKSSERLKVASRASQRPIARTRMVAKALEVIPVGRLWRELRTGLKHRDWKGLGLVPGRGGGTAFASVWTPVRTREKGACAVDGCRA